MSLTRTGLWEWAAAGGEMAYCGECGLECAKHFASIKHPVPQDQKGQLHLIGLLSENKRLGSENEAQHRKKLA